MKILHIFDHSIPLQSGYTFRSRAILRQQRLMGWETLHLTGPKQGKTEKSEETFDELDFYRCPVVDGLVGRIPVWNQWEVVRAIEKRLGPLVKETSPDIIHAHSPALNGIAAVRVGRSLGVPVVYEIRAFWEDAAVDHGTTTEGSLRYRMTRAMETWVAKRADQITVICEGLQDDLVGRGIPRDKITIIPNAVDPQQFEFGAPASEELKQKLGLDEKVVLGFVGSFYAYEGLDLLVEALPKILDLHPRVHLLLVGGGPQNEALKSQVERLGLESAVTFTGRVPHHEVQSYYNLVDLLVYPRKRMRLTDLVTPLKPLEAMAQGKLFVASDVGGHKELVEPGVNGVLFKADDVSALIQAVSEVIGHPERWEAMRRAGRQTIENSRNWGVSAGRYDQVYSACRPNK